MSTPHDERGKGLTTLESAAALSPLNPVGPLMKGLASNKIGYTTAPLWGMGIGASVLFATIVSTVWVGAAAYFGCLVGLIVILFFMRSYNRRESYALKEGHHDLLHDSHTMISLKQLAGNPKAPVNEVEANSLPVSPRAIEQRLQDTKEIEHTETLALTEGEDRK